MIIYCNYRYFFHIFDKCEMKKSWLTLPLPTSSFVGHRVTFRKNTTPTTITFTVSSSGVIFPLGGVGSTTSLSMGSSVFIFSFFTDGNAWYQND